jgi:polysaccharide biosynthesis/export protein
MIRLTIMLLAAAAFCAAQENKVLSSSASTPAVASSPAPASPAANTPAATNSAAPAAKDFKDRSPRYRIEPGDSFDVSFDLSPEFNQTVSVQPDGFVTLRGVGDLKVEGQTVPELTQTLRGAYSKVLHDPIITVVLKDFEKPYFIADGQVAKPGKYEMHGHTTLIQAIAIAGGFQSSAKHSQVLLFRRVDDQWTEAKLFNVKKMQKTGNLSEDPFLHPGDMLFVPKTALSKIDRFIPNMSMGTYLPLALP